MDEPKLFKKILEILLPFSISGLLKGFLHLTIWQFCRILNYHNDISNCSCSQCSACISNVANPAKPES